MNSIPKADDYDRWLAAVVELKKRSFLDLPEHKRSEINEVERELEKRWLTALNEETK